MASTASLALAGAGAAKSDNAGGNGHGPGGAGASVEGGAGAGPAWKSIDQQTSDKDLKNGHAVMRANQRARDAHMANGNYNGPVGAAALYQATQGQIDGLVATATASQSQEEALAALNAELDGLETAGTTYEATIDENGDVVVSETTGGVTTDLSEQEIADLGLDGLVADAESAPTESEIASAQEALDAEQNLIENSNAQKTPEGDDFTESVWSDFDEALGLSDFNEAAGLEPADTLAEPTDLQ